MSANDNHGYHLGIDPEGDLFNEARIADAAKHILAGLRVDLESGSVHLCGMLKNGTAYHNGLTNGETLLAIIRAMGMMQVNVTRKLAGMYVGPTEDEDEDVGGTA